MDERFPASEQPDLTRLFELVLHHIGFNQLARVTLHHRPEGPLDDLVIRTWSASTGPVPGQNLKPKTIAVAKPLGAKLRTFLLAHDGRCLRFLDRHVTIHDALDYPHEAKFSCVECHMCFTLL